MNLPRAASPVWMRLISDLGSDLDVAKLSRLGSTIDSDLKGSRLS